MLLETDFQFDTEAERNECFKIRLDSLGLTKRVEKVLADAGVRTVGGIFRQSEDKLLRLSGLGVKGVKDIEDSVRNALKIYERNSDGKLVERSISHSARKRQP